VKAKPKPPHPATTINQPSLVSLRLDLLPITTLQHHTGNNHHYYNNESRLKPTAPRAAAPTTPAKMPASDYTSTVSGGLKLKGGAKDSGIKKKKKSSSSKKKSAPETTTATKDEGEAPGSEERKPAAESSTALARQASVDEDEEQALVERRSRSSSAVPTNITGTGKTEAQRRHEEIKRKRVSEVLSLSGHDPWEYQPAGLQYVLTSFLHSSTSDSDAKAEPKRTSSESRS
jgi:protein FAM32A